MKKLITILLALAFLAGGWAPPAGAALKAVSPAVDPVNGFPLWYEDATLLRLGQCLDPGFCTAVAPAAGAIAFPANFPVEFFYWRATGGPVADAGLAGNGALIVIALEGSFANGAVALAGDQIAFARIRIRFTPLQSGTFTVTHPFGTIDIVGTAGARVTVTQDVGIAAGIFTGALLDSPAGGIVNTDGRSVGPFLTAAPPNPARVRNPATGNVYIATPGTPIAVTGSPLGTNFFSILGPGVNVKTTSFDMEGKVFGCAATNTLPVAAADAAVAASGTGQAQVINVLANDTPGLIPPDTIAFNPGSVAITVPPTGGTAVANPNGTVAYTPNIDFVGTDTFTYTVQDNCANLSNAIVDSILVERLVVNRAEFRPKTGKWTVTGESSAAAGSVMTVYKGTTTGPVVGTTAVQADGTFKYVGKSKTTSGPPAQPQSVSVQSPATVTTTRPLKVP